MPINGKFFLFLLDFWFISIIFHNRYCASVGRMAPLVGTKERIKFGHLFKEHRDIAVGIDPNERK